MSESRYYSDPANLDQIDWNILKRSDFARTDSDPGKSNRYQAELLVHKRVRMDDLLGLACFNETAKTAIDAMVASAGLHLKVVPKEGWYPR